MAASRTIIWSPHSDRNQFLVSGTELKLYDWIPPSDDGPGKAQFVSNVPKITLVMCADWCPDPTRPDLIAVGLTTGKTLLLRMHDTLTTDASTDSRGGPMSPRGAAMRQYPVLGVKMSRPCNVVSFSKTHPHLLAAGLDKVRNDPCLLVWDVSQAVDSACHTPNTHGSMTPTQSRYNEKIVSHWKPDDRKPGYHSGGFELQQPPPPNANREQRPIQQYGSSEAISSCTWSVQNGSPLLITGMGAKFLRVYDIRAESTAHPLQFNTKAVYGTVVDPFNPNRIASYTEEGILKCWDIRNTSEAVLTLHTDVGKQGLGKIAFSPSRAGVLASLARDTHHLQLWDIQETTSTVDLQDAFEHSTLTSSSAPASQPMISSSKREPTVPVLWKSRITPEIGIKTITSFAFIPPMSGNSSVSRQGILTLHRDGQFESTQLQELCQMAWQPLGGLTLTDGQELSFLNAKGTRQDDMERGLSRLTISETRPTTMDYFGKDLLSELADDISVVMRKRALMGYCMDCDKNAVITRNDPKLHELWMWLGRLGVEQVSKTSAAASTNDIGFQGVYGVWTTPLKKANHLSSPKTFAKDADRRKSTDITIAKTAKLAQRQTALRACGFCLSIQELEQELVKLETAGEYDKAAGLAFFHGCPERAIEALGSERGGADLEDDQQRKLMSGVLAGYQPGSATTVNPTWRTLCESLSQDMQHRPYLSALFAYIASNNWFRVLNESQLSLKERVAIALRVLEDDQITEYLTTLMDYLVETGDVEGILITGLTGKGVDLLEQTVNRFGDVQTPSMVMSYAIRRFKDKRIDHWIDSYRGLLDRWQLWKQRAQFDIERGKRMHNASEIAPPQIYVRCTYCSQSLGHSLLAQNVRSRDGKRMNVQASISPVTSGGRSSSSAKQKPTVCPSCRKPLPRCTICLLHLGTPVDPLRRAITANDPNQADPSGFDLWFTWCQTCRHGGHAAHMRQWFQKHSTCPVSNCSCLCSAVTST